MAFSIQGVSHVGLAPKDPERARWFFGTALGLPSLGEELVVEQETLTIMFESGRERFSGGQRLEVLVPAPAGAGPVGKFLERRGSGLHHVALAVEGLVPLLAHLKTLGVRLLDEVPRNGAHGCQIAFVHPESTGGLLVELTEEPPQGS